MRFTLVFCVVLLCCVAVQRIGPKAAYEKDKRAASAGGMLPARGTSRLRDADPAYNASSSCDGLTLYDAALRANASARSVFANIFMSQIKANCCFNHVVRVRTKDLWSREQKDVV